MPTCASSSRNVVRSGTPSTSRLTGDVIVRLTSPAIVVGCTYIGIPLSLGPVVALLMYFSTSSSGVSLANDIEIGSSNFLRTARLLESTATPTRLVSEDIVTRGWRSAWRRGYRRSRIAEVISPGRVAVRSHQAA